MEEFVEKIEKIIIRENQKLKNELKTELKLELSKELKSELGKELKLELSKELKSELGKELRKELLDYMFVFEEKYGRNINIMFEEIMNKNQKDRNIEEDILILEKRVDKNSAFIMNHENRITTLEETKI